MTGKTAIQWTEKTWNPIVGCSVVSPGCTNCYAMKWAGRRLDGNPKSPHYDGTTMPTKTGPVWTGKVAMAPDHILTAPLRWRKPAKIFTNSMGDLFHESVPDAWIDRVFAIMALTPQHTYQVLTKRAERMKAYMSGSWKNRIIALLIEKYHGPGSPWNANIHQAEYDLGDYGYLRNVWLGVSTEDQARADERIPHLLETPAAVRFISAEPLLGDLDIRKWMGEAICGSTYCAVGENFERCDLTGAPCEGLDWVIAGGESGPDARPMHPDWPRSLRDQCASVGVPFFFKQWGEWAYVADLDDGGERFNRVGKKAAGDLLDGVQYHNWPEK